MTRPNTDYKGVLCLNKRRGITSHDAVMEVRRAIGERRIGHTGTLDPLADGLLPLCIGSATKAARFLSGQSKIYETEICLGKKSPTFDGEGIDTSELEGLEPGVTKAAIEEALKPFVGCIKQRAPVYSAVKVDGRRLYERARAGEEVVPPEREITINSIDLIDYREPILTLRVSCSSGTYIRSLANDIGLKLGCGALVWRLTRTAIGSLQLKDALTIDETSRLHDEGTLAERLLRYDQVLNFSSIVVNDAFCSRALSGCELKREDILQIDDTISAGDTVTLKNSSGIALAVGKAHFGRDMKRLDESGKMFTYLRVLN